MSDLFQHFGMTEAMTGWLLNPGVLGEGQRSCLFLFCPRGKSRTTCLKSALILPLRESGALVIYIDLWGDAQENPGMTIQSAVRTRGRNCEILISRAAIPPVIFKCRIGRSETQAQFQA